MILNYANGYLFHALISIFHAKKGGSFLKMSSFKIVAKFYITMINDKLRPSD